MIRFSPRNGPMVFECGSFWLGRRDVYKTISLRLARKESSAREMSKMGLESRNMNSKIIVVHEKGRSMMRP
jgi:hypothetical protein